MTISKRLSVPMFQMKAIRTKGVTVDTVSTTKDRAAVLHKLLDEFITERLVVMYVDAMDNLVGCEIVGMGGLHNTPANMQEIFRGALIAGVDKIILAHNHPVGNPHPSNPDIEMTAIAMNFGSLLGINVVDHIVVCPDGTHYSMLDNHDHIMQHVEQLKVVNEIAKLLSKNPIASLVRERFLPDS